MMTIVPEIGWHSIGIIHAIQIAIGMIQEYLAETAGPAAYFQYIFASQIFLIPTCYGKKTFRALPGIIIIPVYLCFLEFVPLKPEAVRIVIFMHNSDHASNYRKPMAFFIRIRFLFPFQ